MRLSFFWDSTGAQKQDFGNGVRDADTIQGALESALAAVKPRSLKQPQIYLSSRTDAGVHAISSTVHFELENPYKPFYEPDNLINFINKYFSLTNHDIRILSCFRVKDEFHARYSAKSRSYLYRFMLPVGGTWYNMPVAELQRCHYVSSTDFDIERVKRATLLFLGKRDFRTFAGKSNRELQYVRQLHHFTVEEGRSFTPWDPLAEKFRFFDVKCGARSFLYNQVRRMVGTLIALGSGKITEKDIRCMLEVPSRLNWDSRITPAPPDGLYLLNVNYDPVELAESIIK